MQIGDKVTRMMADISMELEITKITEDLIICGPWTFDRKSGMEIDDDLGWGPMYGITGSFLKFENEN
jgi:hypothetical protein